MQSAPDLYVPAGQGEMEGEVPPPVAAGAAAAQAVAPMPAMVPTAHATHAVIAEEPMAGLAEPAAQGTGAAVPERQ